MAVIIILCSTKYRWCTWRDGSWIYLW